VVICQSSLKLRGYLSVQYGTVNSASGFMLARKSDKESLYLIRFKLKGIPHMLKQKNIASDEKYFINGWLLHYVFCYQSYCN